MWAESINPGRTIWFERKKASTKVQDISSKHDLTHLEESWRVKVYPSLAQRSLRVKCSLCFQFFRLSLKSLGAAAMIALFFWQARYILSSDWSILLTLASHWSVWQWTSIRAS